MAMTRRLDMEKFIAASGWSDADIVALAPDASARNYFRLVRGNETRIIMDAAPPYEETDFFAAKAEIFRNCGWAVPQIFARDAMHGFLLLEDFGADSFAAQITAGANAQEYYFLAVDALIHLHRQPSSLVTALPVFSPARYTYLVSWLIEWYVPLVQPQPLSRVIREEFFDLWDRHFALLQRVPQHACHMDYQCHNFMDRPGQTGLARCGILDFQDAVVGPIMLDLVMLLENARADVPPAIVEACMARYLAAFPKIDRADFAAAYALASAHNAARILGLFARLKIRDHKSQYLQYLPRNLRYFEQSLQHPALTALRAWFDRYVPAEKRLAIAELRAA